MTESEIIILSDRMCRSEERLDRVESKLDRLDDKVMSLHEVLSEFAADMKISMASLNSTVSVLAKSTERNTISLDEHKQCTRALEEKVDLLHIENEAEDERLESELDKDERRINALENKAYVQGWLFKVLLTLGAAATGTFGWSNVSLFTNFLKSIFP